MTDSQHRRSLILLATTSVMWSSGGLLIKSIHLHPLAIAGGRSGIAAVVMWIAAKRLRFLFSKAQWAASLCMAATVILFVTATKLTTAANAILLQYTAPIYVALLSGPLLGEKVRARDWITLFFVMCGMVLFFIEDVSGAQLWGNLVAFASGISFAGIAVFMRMQKGVSTLESLWIGHMLAAVIGLPFLLSGPMPGHTDLALLLALGVFQIGIPYVFYGIAIRHVSALEATLVPVIEPILNPIWVALFFGERPTKYAMAGGMIVISAVLIHSLIAARSKRVAIAAK